MQCFVWVCGERRTSVPPPPAPGFIPARADAPPAPGSIPARADAPAPRNVPMLHGALSADAPSFDSGMLSLKDSSKSYSDCDNWGCSSSTTRTTSLYYGNDCIWSVHYGKSSSINGYEEVTCTCTFSSDKLMITVEKSAFKNGNEQERTTSSYSTLKLYEDFLKRKTPYFHIF